MEERKTRMAYDVAPDEHDGESTGLGVHKQVPRLLRPFTAPSNPPLAGGLLSPFTHPSHPYPHLLIPLCSLCPFPSLYDASPASKLQLSYHLLQEAFLEQTSLSNEADLDENSWYQLVSCQMCSDFSYSTSSLLTTLGAEFSSPDEETFIETWPRSPD